MWQRLLPDAAAWRITTQKTLRSLVEGLSEAPAEARQFIDDIYDDLRPSTTRELEEWERQFGLMPSATASEASRRLALAAAWQAQGGQSPHYIQDVLQAAGFDVYVHEWWVPPNVSPRTARNPRDYTDDPLVGSVQCTEVGFLADQPQCNDGSTPALATGQPQCNRFLANQVRYLVNLNLTDVAPPPVPDDSGAWPYFLYIGGETFPDNASVAGSRREEFERLVLKIRPAHLWIVLLIDYDAWLVGSGEVVGSAGLLVGQEAP